VLVGVAVAVDVGAGVPVAVDVGVLVGVAVGVLVGVGVGVGVRSWIVKVRALDVPPPGGGLNTVTMALPAVAMSAEGMTATSSPLWRKVVARSAPFHRTTDVATKLAPLTMSWKVLPPRVFELGMSEVIHGCGFAGVGVIVGVGVTVGVLLGVGV